MNDGQTILTNGGHSIFTPTAWPEVQFLWPLHPAVGWLNDRLAAFFERPRQTRLDTPRHRAPVLRLPQGLEAGETVVLIAGVLPNRKGHPLIQSWLGVSLKAGRAPEVRPLSEVLTRTRLGHEPVPNQDVSLADAEASRLRSLLPEAIAAARAFFEAERQSYEGRVSEKLQAQREALQRLEGRKLEQLRLGLVGMGDEKRQSRQQEGEREIGKLFAEHLQWVEDTLQTGNDPSLQVMALLLAR